MTIKSNLNQTVFSERRPFYEQELHALPPEPAPEVPDAERPKPIFKRKIFWLILSLLFLFLIIIIVVATLNRGGAPTEPAPEVEEELLVTQSNDPLLRRIIQLEAELKEADPTKPKLVFPALKLDIALD